jgi:hypothetical protein
VLLIGAADWVETAPGRAGVGREAMDISLARLPSTRLRLVT